MMLLGRSLGEVAETGSPSKPIQTLGAWTRPDVSRLSWISWESARLHRVFFRESFALHSGVRCTFKSIRRRTLVPVNFEAATA